MFFIKIVDWGCLQNKHLGNSGIIILWEPVPVFCLLLFLVFQTKEWQRHPIFILNTFSWLPPPQLRPVFLLAAAAPTECCCWPCCRAARFYRWHNCDWEILSVHCDLWAVSLPSSHLPSLLHSLLYQVHLPEAPFRSYFFPCRRLQWFLQLLEQSLAKASWTREGDSGQPPPACVPLNLSWAGDSYPPAPMSCLKSSLSTPLNSCSHLWLLFHLKTPMNDYWLMYTLSW